MGKPNLLYITAHTPFGPPYGARLRVLNLARLLGEFCDVCFFFCCHKWPTKEEIQKVKYEFGVEHVTRLKDLGAESWKIKIKRNLDPCFLNTEGLLFDEADKILLFDRLKRYDIVWIHTIQLANTLGLYRWPRSILDIDDVPSQFHKSAYASARSMRECMYRFRQVLVWRRREKYLGERFDKIVVCSEEDKKYLNIHRKVYVIPNGFSLPKTHPVRYPVSPPRLGFIGILSYWPNRESVFWFLKSVWPMIKRIVPKVRLRLVGKGSKEIAEQFGSDVDGLGVLLDPSEEIASWSAMIVPLRIGGGTRIKIAEAFSRKCPVVSTSLGAFGYNVRNGYQLLLADNERDFALACIKLLTDHKLGMRLVNNAWKMFCENLVWDCFTERIGNLIEGIK